VLKTFGAFGQIVDL
jgi:hypothetical protein